MTNILSLGLFRPTRTAVHLLIAAVSLVVGHAVSACETPPNLHIEVAASFNTATIRNDYKLADIAALAHQVHREVEGERLGFYASEFGYTIDVLPADNQACPAQIETRVTLRLRHRLIEIGQEAASNACLYPLALQHYQRLARADEQAVERFSARAAAMLAKASPDLKQIHPPDAEDLDAALREQIHAVVDKAIAPLHDARLEAQQAINNPDELRQLAHSCSI